MTLPVALRAWLLDTDPALRWQVQRDLLDEPAATWQATRALVATEGMGARLLALQDEDGQWAGGAYFPSRWDRRATDPEGPPDAGGQPWIATTWTLNTLREWGLDASALAGTAEKLRQNSTWEYDDLPYWGGEVDCCINAFTLANGAWLGADVSGLVDWFGDHQLADGGWNCEWENGSVRSSFHSTLNSLAGLLTYQELTGDPRIVALRRPAEEYLLTRRAMVRASDGQRVGDWLDEFGYPFRWRYNVLKAADYFRRAAAIDGTAPDPRLGDAIAVIRGKRQPDGSWLQDVRHAGQQWFPIDVAVGEASPWLTLIGTRVLRWWDGG